MKRAQGYDPVLLEVFRNLFFAASEEMGAALCLASVATLAGPTGLLAEEVDPATGRALGNHPQAYSHLGLITNALHLAGR